MRDLNNLLLLYTLQVAVESLKHNPDQAIDDSQFQLVLARKIEELRSRTHLRSDGWTKPDPAAFEQKTALLT